MSDTMTVFSHCGNCWGKGKRMGATSMATRMAPARPPRLSSVREMQVAGDDNHESGGGLPLRVAAQSAYCVFRHRPGIAHMEVRIVPDDSLLGAAIGAPVQDGCNAENSAEMALA